MQQQQCKAGAQHGSVLDIVKISHTRSNLVCIICRKTVATWDSPLDRNKMFSR